MESLEQLQKQFYLNKNHLRNEPQDYMQRTLHQYYDMDHCLNAYSRLNQE